MDRHCRLLVLIDIRKSTNEYLTGEGTNARMISEWLKIDPEEDKRCGEKKKTCGE